MLRLGIQTSNSKYCPVAGFLIANSFFEFTIISQFYQFFYPLKCSTFIQDTLSLKYNFDGFYEMPLMTTSCKINIKFLHFFLSPHYFHAPYFIPFEKFIPYIQHSPSCASHLQTLKGIRFKTKNWELEVQRIWNCTIEE